MVHYCSPHDSALCFILDTLATSAWVEPAAHQSKEKHFPDPQPARSNFQFPEKTAGRAYRLQSGMSEQMMRERGFGSRRNMRAPCLQRGICTGDPVGG